MTLAVRWWTDEPERVVERLARGLRVQPRLRSGPVADEPGWAFEFPAGRLLVVRVVAGGRTGLQLDETGRPSDGGARESDGPAAPLGPDLAAVGWATVDTERAAADLDVDLVPLPADELLGATAALGIERGGVDARRPPVNRRLVLLEPTTEGRLAAGLVRFGEGPAALYFVDSGAGSAGAGARFAAGPFGRQALVPGGPAWGPHVVVGDRHLLAIHDAGTMRPMMDERAVALRGATLADAERIAALLTDEGFPAGASDIEERLEAFDSAGSAVLVAESGGEVLGFIALHVVPRFEHGDRFVRIVALVVDPGVRDRGLGHRLMAEAERVGREVGAAFTEVTSGHHRPETRRFYESLGYDASVTTYLRKRI